MKRIFTLVTLFACTSIFAVNSYSQNISQNFNSLAEVNQMATECWSFSNIGFSTSSPIEGAGSLIHQGQGVGASSLTTPELNITSALNISFSYSGRRNRQITISLIGADTVVLHNFIIANNN